MKRRIAIIGAGVSGLTCAVALAERGNYPSIFADEITRNTTSAVAAAIWYPYDAEPVDRVIPWALETYNALLELSGNRDTGVSMIEFRNFSRTSELQIPQWARSLGVRRLTRVEVPPVFSGGFAINVPLVDTTIYLDYLIDRLRKAGGEIEGSVHFDKLEDVDRRFGLVINCTGIGAETIVPDSDLEPHRGQVVSISKPVDLKYAIACNDAPLLYAIPRADDCVLGGTNEISDDRTIDPASTSRIVAECSCVLSIDPPKVIGVRVGLRPFRKSGVRLERNRLSDGRTIIHNYGHGGSGFTLSWGCAEGVVKLVGDFC